MTIVKIEHKDEEYFLKEGSLWINTDPESPDDAVYMLIKAHDRWHTIDISSGEGSGREHRRGCTVAIDAVLGLAPFKGTLTFTQ